MKKNALYLFLSTCLISTYSFAEESWLNWQSNSISALYGKGFEVEPDTHETITFEHASSWKWGDLYLFVDTYWFDGEKTASQGHNAVYTEIAPRFSIGKLTNTNLSFGPVKDVLIATSFDLSIQDQPGYDDMWTYLVGPGFDLDIKGFDYFTLNFYIAFQTMETPQVDNGKSLLPGHIPSHFLNHQSFLMDTLIG